MKKIFAAVVSAAALSGSLFADGVEFKLDKPSDWNISGNVTWVGEKKDVIQAKGGVFLTSKKLFDVDAKKKYKLEADAKMISGGPAFVYVGFIPCDKNGADISAVSVNAVGKSETAVAVAGKVGDTKLILNSNPNWNVQFIYAAALNAKADYSDLPSKDLLEISAVKNVDGKIELTLKKPLAKAVAAGTVVRAHRGGGYMYTAGFKKLADGESFEFKGVAQGMLKSEMRTAQWAPGTAKAKVVLLINWGAPKAVSQVKDIELEIEK